MLLFYGSSFPVVVVDNHYWDDNKAAHICTYCLPSPLQLRPPWPRFLGDVYLFLSLPLTCCCTSVQEGRHDIGPTPPLLSLASFKPISRYNFFEASNYYYHFAATTATAIAAAAAAAAIAAAHLHPPQLFSCFKMSVCRPDP